MSGNATRPAPEGAARSVFGGASGPVSGDATRPVPGGESGPVSGCSPRPVPEGAVRRVPEGESRPVSRDAPRPASRDATRPLPGDAARRMPGDVPRPVSGRPVRRRSPGARLRASGGVRVGLAALVLAAIASGCAQGGAGDEVTPAGGQQPLDAPPARALDSYASRLGAAHAARVAAAHRWGLAQAPLSAPPPPARKPRIRTREGFEVTGHRRLNLPPVFTTVPTRDKVVFLTIDDGAEKDPAFLRMMSDLDVPYTAFLSGYLVKDDPRYFRRMQARGVALNNHTLHHPRLPSLSYRQQKREICGMQRYLAKRFGTRPALFRPSYGSYDRTTLRAAKACGIAYVPLWNQEVFPDRWEYREGDRRLRPGDIVLTHFRGREQWKGSMADMIRRFLNEVRSEGFAVGRLEDYL